MNEFARLDQAHVWHPFTQMRDWLSRPPIVITRGKGAELEDVEGRRYLDANSSIWTNLHGHNHPAINRAIVRQLKKIAHSSALGLANEPASLLAERLITAANRGLGVTRPRRATKLEKVFYSDDGSTALEVALKLAYEYGRRAAGKKQPTFLSLTGAYHGDTIGAVSLGHIDLFHRTYKGLLFRTDSVMAPYCYRCPFNRAKPERADAREYRRCKWECVGQVEQQFVRQARRGESYTAFVFEPLMQGAAGMIPQPTGWLRDVAQIVRGHGSLLIADEVMTGFGRTGNRAGANTTLFASHHEGVQPDLLCLAKGLTGGYLPMAATLTTKAIFEVFLGEYAEFKTFFHGHSYTGNQLGAAAALASLELLENETSARRRTALAEKMRTGLAQLWSLPAVGDIRQAGLVAGVELVRDWATRTPFDLGERVGTRVCDAMARRGVLTRPIGNVIVLMPPYCTTGRQLHQMIQALAEAIEEVL